MNEHGLRFGSTQHKKREHCNEESSQPSCNRPQPVVGKRVIHLAFPAALLLFTGVGVNPITAQESVTALEEVIVTARRRDERDIDVPISMSVMDEELLRKQNVTELNDLGIQVPGLRMSNSVSSTVTPIISMRGQRPNDLSISVDQAVPIYFNEVVITPPEGSNLALYDLQSVQVLKGPHDEGFRNVGDPNNGNDPGDWRKDCTGESR